MRVRGIRPSVEEIKELDPNTSFNEYALRQLIKSGAIPYMKSGRRILIDLDTLLEYLANPMANK